MIRFLSALAGTMLAAAVPGGAVAAVRDAPVAGFDRIELAAAARMDVRTGGAFALHAEGDQRLIDALAIDVRNGTLVIAWRHGFRVESIRREGLRIAVTLPRLAGVDVSGAGTVAVDRIAGRDFTGTVGGAGTLTLPSLRAEHAAFTIGGAGHVVAAGTAARIDVQVSGVGSIDAVRLIGQAGRLRLSGTGSIRATIDGPVDVGMSGVGSVTVLGHPRCTVQKSGFGSVRCGA